MKGQYIGFDRESGKKIIAESSPALALVLCRNVKYTELQIRGGIQDNSEIIFLVFLNENICCDPSLEP